jgi:hypothetical protein
MNSQLLQYRDDVERFADFIKKIPSGAFHFKPAPEKWSIHEIIIHVTDSDVNSYIRLRKALAENGAAVVAYDQDRWAVKLNYPEQSIEKAIQLLRLMREINFSLLKSLKEDDWQKTYLHPENGNVTVEEWLKTYTDHISGHIGQMQRNLDAWKEDKS